MDMTRGLKMLFAATVDSQRGGNREDPVFTAASVFTMLFAPPIFAAAQLLAEFAQIGHSDTDSVWLGSAVIGGASVWLFYVRRFEQICTQFAVGTRMNTKASRALVFAATFLMAAFETALSIDHPLACLVTSLGYAIGLNFVFDSKRIK
jgi:hypothetical protein